MRSHRWRRSCRREAEHESGSARARIVRCTETCDVAELSHVNSLRALAQRWHLGMSLAFSTGMTLPDRRVVRALLVTVLLVIPTAARAASLTIAWDPETGVAGFVVLYGTQSGIYTNSIDAGTATQQQITGLVSGTTYYFVVESYDSAGNRSSASAEVSQMTIGMNIACPAPSGASITGSPIVLTFSPIVSGGTAPINTSCAPASGSSFPVGTTTLTCNATDATALTASCASSAVVAGPSVPPLAISCPAIPTAVANNGKFANVTYTSPTVTGGVAPLGTTCSPASGSQFAVGTTTVTCTAVDAASDSASCTTTATVTTNAGTPAPSGGTAFSGMIMNLTGKCPTETFTAGEHVVTTSASTTYTGGSCGSLSNGRTVTIAGTVQANGSVVAASISYK
jgi:hypothetical protein